MTAGGAGLPLWPHPLCLRVAPGPVPLHQARHIFGCGLAEAGRRGSPACPSLLVAVHYSVRAGFRGPGPVPDRRRTMYSLHWCATRSAHFAAVLCARPR